MRRFSWFLIVLLTTVTGYAQDPAPLPEATASVVTAPDQIPASEDGSGAEIRQANDVSPANPAPASTTPDGQPYVPPTSTNRVDWFAESTFGPTNWAAGAFICGFWTAFNQPEEWGGSADGFAKRLAVRQSGVILSNAMEAGLGSFWGEDPRYFRHGRGRGFWPRVGWALKTSVTAYDRSGRLRPAYARYAAAFGNNYITNAWRPESDNGPGDAARRGALGLLGRFASNLFMEFWPDVTGMIRKK
jgi:hypothetical protein